MQRIRGYLYFEKGDVEEVKEKFLNYKLDNIEIKFFKSIKRDNKELKEPGVFIDGEVNNKYSSKDIVNIFRKHINLEEKIINCDISIESEDIIIEVKNKSLVGNYIGIRIKPPYEIKQIENISKEIDKLINPYNILIRGVETEKDNDKPIICIDLIIRENYDKYKDNIEKIIRNNNLEILNYTYISLI